MKRRYYLLALLILSLLSLVLLGAAPARAEEEPAPGVARISLIHGDVSTQRGDSGDWVASTVNAPVVRGDKVSTGARSRTEVQLDYANILRLDQSTEAKIADLTRTRIQVQVAQGLVNFSVLKGSEADVEIDTPNVAVRPLGEGSCRIQVNSNSETQVTIRKGEAEISTSQGSTTVRKNELITIQGTDSPQYQIAKAAHKDEWDEWNNDRDRDIRDAHSWRYANRYYTGAHDLDSYGHWTYVPDYDWCWTPYTYAGWVPYRDGRWLWEPYWGWTWVSYEPWGWAPYHYGRWFYYGNSWSWWPGYGYGGYGYGGYGGYYPSWAPAYVSFLGFGFGGRNWHFGFGFGFGSIGWLPLGPYDHYYPWHGRGNSYNVVNITNITNITNVTNVAGNVHVRNTGRQPYVSNVYSALNNERVRGAITTVSAEDFVRGRVPRNPQAVDAATLRQGQLVQGTVPAVPTRDSLRPVDRAVNTASLPARANASENFFARRQPPTGPQPFAERAAQIQQMMERHNPLDTANRGATGNVNVSTPAQQGQFNRPGSGSTARPAAAGAPSNALNSSEAAGSRVTTTSPAVSGAINAGNRATAPGAAQSERTIQEQPVERPGWQRFGQGPTPGVRNFPTAPAAQAEMAQKRGTAPRSETPPAQPAQQPARPGWQRFGTGQAQPAPGRPATTGSPTEARQARQPAAPPVGAPPAERATDRSGWQRFGSSQPRPTAPVAGEPGAASAPVLTPRQTMRPLSQPAPEPAGERADWQRFSNAPSAGRSAPSGLAPREAPATSRAPQPRPAPSTAGEQPAAGGWRQFTSESRPAPAERSFGSPAPRAEPSSPGWSRSPSRSEAPVYREAPRSYERPPLDIRKPIVTERPAPPPRSFEGGGWTRGGGAPQGGGGNRGWSAPSGGGRSAPSPPPAPRQSEQRGKH